MTSAALLAKIGNTHGISASVGSGGVNRAIDVAIVQHLLLRNLAAKNRPVGDLALSGLPNQALTDALTDFQGIDLKIKKPDGRVDPTGRTLKALRAVGGTQWLPSILTSEENFALWTSMRSDRYLDLYGAQYGPALARQATALKDLVDRIIADGAVYDIRWGAYLLATARGEAGASFSGNIEESPSLWGQHTGAGDYAAAITVTDAAGNSKTVRYYGRGYVQLTWQKNYRKMADLIPEAGDLVGDPGRALLPDVAYRIASQGMRDGTFTGVNLYNYMHGSHCDYYNARRIINGLDRAAEFERWAIAFECLLLLSTLA